MTPAAVIIAPQVRCFSGKQDFFIHDGERYRRTTPEDEAHFYTGYDRETHEPSVGIYIVPRGNGLLTIGFDLWKIGANLRPSAVEWLERRWQQREAVNLSASMLRSVGRRVHISKSFARFEISLHRLEEWQAELSAILSNPESYEQL